MSQRSRRNRRRGGARQGADRRRRLCRPGRRARDRGHVSWVLDVAAEAPSLSSCKPVEKGGNSVIYAGDGSRLGVVASDEARTPVALRPHAEDLRKATIAIEDERFYEHGGVDIGSDPARRDQGPGSGRGGRGRLDDHPAAGPQPLHLQPEAQPRTQDHRGEAGDRVLEAPLEGRNPRPVPEHGLLRDRQRQHRGRRPGGVADLLLEAGLEAEPGAVGAARRPAPGADRLQPDPQPRAAPGSAATRCWRRWRELGFVTRPRRGRRSPERPRPRRRQGLLHPPPALLLRLRRGRADRGLRRQHRAPRRPARIHDDRPEAPAGRAGGDRTRPSPTKKTPRRRSSRSTRATAGSGRWSRAPTTTTASSTSPPRATASPARPSRRSS